MSEKILKKDYETVPYVITSDNIELFEAMQNRRLLGSYHVQQIHGAILKEKNPIGTIIVNKIGGVMRVIDGNHRIEAVKRFYSTKESNSTVSFECDLRVYSNLKPREEVDIYHNEAKRKNESYEDRLNLNKDFIPIWKLFQDKSLDFPCSVSIYPSTNTLRLKTILNAFYVIKGSSEKGFVPESLNKNNLIDFAQSLGVKDYNFLKDFLAFFKRVFGEISTSNLYLKNQYFVPLFDIYYRNQQYMKDKNFEDRFSRLIGKHDLIMLANTNGREWKIKIRELMIGYLNWGFSRKKFI